MKTEQLTVSAALFFPPQGGKAITLRWFERARELFLEYALSPILFSADGGGFVGDDCHVLAGPGGDIIDDEGYVLTARGGDLVDALRRGDIETLDLDSPRSIAGGRSDWRASASIWCTLGDSYIGIDEDLVGDTSDLLRRAYAIAGDLVGVRYGIAYKLRLADDPGCYAIGRTTRYTFSMFREQLRAKRAGTYRHIKSREDLWSDELIGKRRHLTGLFRGAYPASILSEAHLERADLRSHRIGRLSKLDASLWLWELSDAEVPIAEKLLERAGALVASCSEGS